jgi:thiamine monophosphate kinase
VQADVAVAGDLELDVVAGADAEGAPGVRREGDAVAVVDEPGRAAAGHAGEAAGFRRPAGWR